MKGIAGSEESMQPLSSCIEAQMWQVHPSPGFKRGGSGLLFSRVSWASSATDFHDGSGECAAGKRGGGITGL